MRYQKVPANIQGRDFIVGDLHGCYTVLKRLLSHVGFHSDVDRLFLVGDLIDRELESEKCLQLLLEPWCYAVQGNHEQMFINMVANNVTWLTLQDYWREDIGGGWTRDWFERNAPELRFWSNVLEKLPYVLEVEGYETLPFWVVHAEIWSPHYEITPANIVTAVEYSDPAQVRVFQWSRMLVKHRHLGGSVRLPGPIYCGHTPTPNPGTLRLGHINLDGGAGVGPWASKCGITKPQLFMWCHTTNQGYAYPVART